MGVRFLMASIQRSVSNALRTVALGRNNSPERQSGSARVAMVLCNASYYGTLAAVRSLGRAGVPVVTVDPAILALARYSRYSSLHLSSPPFEAADWSDWLLAVGRGGPRRAIYATSDAVSFALADHREELSSVFDLYQPDLDTMMCILDKGLLLKQAHAVGIDTPETWFPRSGDEAERIVRDVGGTIVAKPRSQLAVPIGVKGVLITAAAGNGCAEYDDLLRQSAHNHNFAKRFPEATMPMLQRYHPEAIEKIYSLSGFRDISGTHVVMRAAQKILQRPRRFGIGLCFEEADVISELAERTVLLCERIGYYGAFELEFIISHGRSLLIDFNGRFYNQLAFDIARGMDLPRLVYAGATRDPEELTRLISAVPRRDKGEGLIFCNRFVLSLTVAAQQALRKMSTEEANRWREWRNACDGRLVDAVSDANDPFPALVDVAQHVWQSVRHPRGYFRQTASMNVSGLWTTAMAAGAL
jgi:D-aspartate ligase